MKIKFKITKTTQGYDVFIIGKDSNDKFFKIHCGNHSTLDEVRDQLDIIESQVDYSIQTVKVESK